MTRSLVQDIGQWMSQKNAHECCISMRDIAQFEGLKCTKTIRRRSEREYDRRTDGDNSAFPQPTKMGSSRELKYSLGEYRDWYWKQRARTMGD